MNMIEALLQAQGGGAVEELGQKFGLDQSQVASAISALAPALAAGFQRNMSSPQGLDSLLGALGSGGHSRYVDSAGALGSAASTLDGNGILGHVFGSKDVSRQVAARAAAQTGIGENLMKQMLPLVAAMMMGTMAKRMGQSPSYAGAPGSSAAGADLMGMLSPMLDSNRDGSMVDDVMGIVGRMFTKR
jgi:hypothetical protein